MSEQKCDGLDSCVVRCPGKHRSKPACIGRVDVSSVLDEPSDQPELSVVGGVVQRGASLDEGLAVVVGSGPFELGDFWMMIQNLNRLLLAPRVVFRREQT